MCCSMHGTHFAACIEGVRVGAGHLVPAQLGAITPGLTRMLAGEISVMERKWLLLLPTRSGRWRDGIHIVKDVRGSDSGRRSLYRRLRCLTADGRPAM